MPWNLEQREHEDFGEVSVANITVQAFFSTVFCCSQVMFQGTEVHLIFLGKSYYILAVYLTRIVASLFLWYLGNTARNLKIDIIILTE